MSNQTNSDIEAKAKAESKAKAKKIKLKKPYKEEKEDAPEGFIEVRFNYIGKSNVFEGKVVSSRVSPKIAEIYKEKKSKNIVSVD